MFSHQNHTSANAFSASFGNADDKSRRVLTDISNSAANATSFFSSKNSKSDQYGPVVKKAIKPNPFFNNVSANSRTVTAPKESIFFAPPAQPTTTSSNVSIFNAPPAQPTTTASNASIFNAPPAQSSYASIFNAPPAQPTTTAPVAYKDPSGYQFVGKADDIDERDRHDPLAVAEYAEEMYVYFKEQERTTSVRPHYLSLQPQVNESMRAVLVDWLINVHVEFKLVPDTLYLAVNILDRYLEKTEVSRTKLQLVGATALFIAAKYEEVWAPRIFDIVSVCDNLYPSQEIVQMEKHILNALQYRISMPTAYTFLVRYLKAGHADAKIAQVASYILEGSLMSYPLLQYLPSQLAAAAVLIGRNSTGRNPWSPTLLKYAQYFEEDIAPVAREMLEKKSRMPANITAVHKKYASKRLGRVSGATFLSCE